MILPSELWENMSVLLSTWGIMGKALEDYQHLSDIACVFSAKWVGYQYSVSDTWALFCTLARPVTMNLKHQTQVRVFFVVCGQEDI